MSTQWSNPAIAMSTVSGLPHFAVADELRREILADAGLTTSGTDARPSPTAFHIATDSDGRVLGVASTTVGPLADLPLGLALRAAGAEVDDDQPVPGPTCELVSLAVNRTGDTDGVAELLYRAFYQHAVRSAARSIVIGVDPWLVDLLREQYGVPLETIGPLLDLLGRQLLPVGGDLSRLEANVATQAPDFHAFLTAGLPGDLASV